MALSLRPAYVRRYKDIVRLLWRYGRDHLGSQTEFGVLAKEADLDEDDLSRAEESDDLQPQEQLAADLERLGPTFVKLGQLLSTRPDLLSEPYRVALERLQDDVEPMDYGTVEETVERELGVKISKAFESFESEPVASASLGQVHRATLRDGREVAVKVQRAQIEEEVRTDLGALHEIARFCEARFDWARRYRMVETIHSFSASLVDELDYEREASNLRRLRKALADIPTLRVPATVEDYTSRRVLTMEYISGTSVTDVSQVVISELDGEALADDVFRAYLQQILVDGFFHADPHPGNLLLTHDHRIALLDLGMVGFVTASEQRGILQLLLAISERDGEAAADTAIRMSALREDADVATFKRELSHKVFRHEGQTIEQLQVGSLVIDLTQLAARHGVLVPSSLNLIAKTLLNLDLIGATLAPKFNPVEAIREHVGEISSSQLTNDTSLGSILRGALEVKDFASKLPHQLSTILDRVADNELQVQVETFDEKALISGLQQMANRITSGLVLAALIVGAALLMRIDTPGFRLLGYPGFAIVLFSVAAFLGLRLVLQIWSTERSANARRRGRRSS